jgi:hypothetical protein
VWIQWDQSLEIKRFDLGGFTRGFDLGCEPLSRPVVTGRTGAVLVD